MATYVGLDPAKDINWVTSPSAKPMELFAEGKIDAFLGFPPEPQELRARKIGHVIVNSAVDRPWSQYFCCMLAGNSGLRPQASGRDQARRCAPSSRPPTSASPSRSASRSGWSMAGSPPRYDYALQTLTEIPYDSWREYDPEDTMRFYALRLHEAGMIKSSPQQDHRRGHRLALPERAQARAEGVSDRRRSRRPDLNRGDFRCRSDRIAAISWPARRWPRPSGVLGARGSLADEGPPETTTVRLTTAAGICIAPQYIAEELLRAEGFTDVRYVPATKGPPGAAMIARGELDFASTFAASTDPPDRCRRADHGARGVHPGCFELFAHEPHPHHQRPEGQAGRRPGAWARARIST